MDILIYWLNYSLQYPAYKLFLAILVSIVASSLITHTLDTHSIPIAAVGPVTTCPPPVICPQAPRPIFKHHEWKPNPYNNGKGY